MVDVLGRVRAPSSIPLGEEVDVAPADGETVAEDVVVLRSGKVLTFSEVVVVVVGARENQLIFRRLLLSRDRGKYAAGGLKKTVSVAVLSEIGISYHPEVGGRREDEGEHRL